MCITTNCKKCNQLAYAILKNGFTTSYFLNQNNMPCNHPDWQHADKNTTCDVVPAKAVPLRNSLRTQASKSLSADTLKDLEIKISDWIMDKEDQEENVKIIHMQIGCTDSFWWTMLIYEYDI